MLAKLWLLFCILINGTSAFGQMDPYVDRPKIMIQDGNLIFVSSNNKNVSFLPSGRGTVLFNNVDISKMASSMQSVGSSQLSSVTLMVRQLAEHRRIVAELSSQVNQMEENITLIYNRVNRFLGSGSDRISNRALRRTMSKVGVLTERVNTLTQLLTQNECSSNPCRNGGTCVDAYNGFICKCPSNFEGAICDTDVNECSIYAGTSFGCQNGATCINTHGGYSCVCPPNWYGIDCSEKHDDCSSASHYELCGHGTCVDEKRIQPGQPKYRCICDAGWKLSSNGFACTEDLDECNGSERKCSQNPPVTCVNTPGSFHCGPCPSGYTGNGYYCNDINECEMYNGGCSMHPFVPCVNTYGSSQCGSCPTGYVGNGRQCSFSGVCSINRGGCHPNATCIENSAITGTFRECRCPPGYGGDGVGLHGCNALSGMSCANNPCRHGRCEVAGSAFHCICFAGYYGPLCDREEDPCFSQPCQNGGTCDRRMGSYVCLCPDEFQGPTCADRKQSCGGYLNGPNGTLTYPENGRHYDHKQDCAWVIRVSPSKVVSVTVNHFNLESGENCQYDFLQLNDGPTAASRVINRFCDDHLHGQSFNSTHNELYMWFHSDVSFASTGFSMDWTEVDPICGGELNSSDYGSINSPGYPGPYPHNRTCAWLVTVPIGKRIQFHFATLKLETHENCSFDYLKIFDGATETDPLIGTYCTTLTPPPLTTSGHSATLIFHSDASVQDTGFHIVYSSQSNVQGCGGTLTAPTGTVNSPNFPDVYENNLVCEWLIRIPPDNRIRLTFQEFAVESHGECLFDNVEVFAGANDAAPLLGRYCGSTIPNDLVAESHQLFIRFKSDSSLKFKGFKAEYRTICGGVYLEPTGILSSPYYPESYPARSQCIYEIRMPPGNLINLTFHNMDIEEHPDCNFDYLQVRDGDKEDSTIIAQLCGTNTPDAIISTYNFLWMKFETDGSVQNRGFYAIYDTIEIGCGGVMTEPSGEISSPRHPSAYPHSLTCHWLLKAPPGHVIRITFTSFHLEQDANCRFDYLLVEDTSGVQIGRYCGNRRPPILTSMDETMLVKFESDSSVARDGFIGTYEFLNSKDACGGEYYQDSGVIRSPGFPTHYPHSAHCVWILHASSHRQISLNVTSFQLEEHMGCRYDYLEIRNGGTETSPLLGKFCGNQIMQAIRSHSNVLRMEFKTDTSMSAPGFEIYFDTTTTGCGGKMTSPRGTIVSPNFPQAYPFNADCTWVIQVSAGSVISLNIIDIDVEEHADCMFDYVQVFDGNSENSKSLVRLCNNQQNPGPITSSGSAMLIRFRSDASREARGFQLAYQTLCNNVLKTRTGIIESPNFPNTYPHNHNCSWTLAATPGNNISIAFSHFFLEGGDTCDSDYVEVLEVKLSGEQTQLGKYCGNSTTLPRRIETTTNKAIIRLITDRSVSREGFRLEWRFIGCGGEITNKNSGEITSPNYPEGYPFSTICIWTFSYLPGERVELKVIDLELEAGLECTYDYLRVYGGEDEESPRLLNICDKINEPQIVSSHGNTMMVQFASDHSIARKGFRAAYTKVPSGCGGVFSADESNILSPNFPNAYNANDACEWLIKVDPAHVIVLEFYDFDLPLAPNCTSGYVVVHDGHLRTSPQILKHCGDQKPEGEITSTGNRMLIRLIADGRNVGKGFRAHYKLGCGARLLADDGGVITSPNYPDIPMTARNCSWIIYASDPGEKVILTITHLYIPSHQDCGHSSLMLLDGDMPDSPLIKETCGSKSELPVVSESNKMHVFMKGFGIFRASYGLVSMHCGGSFTSVEGTFATPGYPHNYDMSMECVWTIEASAGNRIHLSFEDFNIESSEYCNNDYVEIHENDASGLLIGKYCGQTIPSNITSVQKLWIKFRSDDIGTNGGFLANYELTHGTQLQGNEGIIESPGYPHKFHKNGDYEWTIMVNSDMFVSLQFMELSIVRVNAAHVCSSVVKIFNGFDDTAPVLGEYCGYQIPEPVISTGNVIFIKYHAANFKAGSFRLQWTAVTETGIVVDVPHTENLCWEEIQLNSSGHFTISSPNYPHNYPNSINCTYIIRGPVYQHVELNISELQLESGAHCEYDSLSVYYLTNPSINEWIFNTSVCGLKNSSVIFASPTSMMKLVMATDKYMNFKGFTATASSKCGTTLTGSTGVIKSEHIYSGTSQLGRQQTFNCEYVIKVRQRRTIQLSFNSFNVPSDGVCASNYIMLRNGGTSSSPFLGSGKYCGTNTPPALETTSNNVYVQVFVSSIVTTIPHFEIRYTEVSVACGGQLYLTDQVTSLDMMSPNYPNPPTHDIECEWVITSPSGTRMRMDFENEFHLDPNCYEGDKVEYLEVNDGGTEMAPNLHRFCGHDQPSSVMSTGNALFVRYVTAVDDPQPGFKATVRKANCGGTISAYEAVITSPHYPGSYGNSEECEWFLKMTKGYHIILSITDLDTPRRSSQNCTTTDYLEIRNIDSAGEVLGIYCGTIDIAIIINVPGPQAYVKFKSNSANTGRGFSMRMTLNYDESCSAQIDSPTGVITSPRYPNPLQGARDCIWFISAPEGRKVKITFQELNLPRDETTGLCISFLTFSNVSTWRSRFTEPDKICGNMLPDPIDSKSGSLDIAFSTRGLSAGQGFSLTYTTDEESFCGGPLYLPSGVLATPSFTFQNHTFADCKWKIYNENAGNTTVVIRFDVIDLPGDKADYCRNSVMYIIGEKTYYIGRYCGNYTSQVTVTSPFSFTLVRMITNLDTPFRGIHATYNVSNCGGILDANNANITSPGYPNNYPINTDCHWLITAYDGGEIRLTFTDLRMEENCNKDYLIIRNGHHATSPILGKFCGTHIPVPVISSRNTLTVIFHTDEYGSAPGFSLTTTEIQSGCGGLIHMTSGNISSPNYPSRYGNNIECVWVIEYVPGYLVKLEFTGRFELEMSDSCEKDYIKIEELGDGSTKEMKKCGSSIPETIIGKSRKMRLTFHTDDRITGDGFNVKYSAVCGGNFTDFRGEIFSPNYPDNYVNDMSCEYVIGKPNQYISLIFDENFSLEDNSECTFDYITLSHGNVSTSSQGPYCGSVAPAPRTLEGPVVLIFKTDASYTTHGFKVTYEVLDCGGANLTDNNGLIGTPGQSRGYLQWMDCTWSIQARANRVVALRFIRMNIRIGYRCWQEYLEIRDGTELDPVIGKICGNSTPIVKSTGSALTVKLHMRPESGGFLAFYYFTYGPTQGCGGTLRLSSGNLESFDADKNGIYEPNLDCNWLIVGDDVDKVFQITFERFDLENSNNGSCIYDYLELREGDSFGSVIGKYCGSVLPSTIITAGNTINVLFHTNLQTNKRGFKFAFTSIDSPCGQSILISSPDSKMLTSPNYPNPYPVNLRCRWSIVRNFSSSIRTRDRVQIDFSDVDIPCQGDYLNIQKIPSRISYHTSSGRENSPASLQVCGSNINEVVANSGMQIIFHSDSTADEARGFSLRYKDAVCNRTYTKSGGVITSFGYPSGYSAEKGCNMSIRAPSGKTISLYFYQMEIHSPTNNCDGNYFKVYDGIDRTAPLIDTYCNLPAPPKPIFSAGNSLYMESYLNNNIGLYQITYMTTGSYRGCGGVVNAEEGAFSSPMFPTPFNRSADCMWYISFPAYHTGTVNLRTFNLSSTAGCTTNYLEIYDGHSGDISERVVRYCGTDNPAIHTSRSNAVLIKLVTDTSNTGSGFFITFGTNPFFPSSSRAVIQRHEQEGINPEDRIIYLF